MTNEEAKHKMDFLKKSYQKLIDEKVDSGKLVGDGVMGEWKAETPLDEAYKSMIEALDLAINALEQQPCEDCISRTEVLDIINFEDEWLFDANSHNADTTIAFSTIKSKISEMPSVTPKARWIPVSERLPKDIKPVIVTWKNTDPKSYYQYIVGKHFIGTAHYKSGKWFWYSSVTEDLLAEYGKCDSEEFDEAIEVVAWMPLPEPYRAESEELNEHQPD